MAWRALSLSLYIDTTTAATTTAAAATTTTTAATTTTSTATTTTTTATTTATTTTTTATTATTTASTSSCLPAQDTRFDGGEGLLAVHDTGTGIYLRKEGRRDTTRQPCFVAASLFVSLSPFIIYVYMAASSMRHVNNY